MARPVNSGALAAQRMLRTTQFYKYSDLNIFLRSIGESYNFEYIIPGTHFIYDLCLHDRRILIEFDGKSHTNKAVKLGDLEKELIAEENGYLLERISVDDNLVIPAEVLAHILQKYNKLAV